MENRPGGTSWNENAPVPSVRIERRIRGVNGDAADALAVRDVQAARRRWSFPPCPQGAGFTTST